MKENRKIEVARFKSILFDVAGTDENRRKGRAPKGYVSCGLPLGHTVKNRMTVICIRWGAIKNESEKAWYAVYCEIRRGRSSEWPFLYDRNIPDIL